MQNNNRQIRRWTNEEEQRLLRQVKAFPTNLSKCFTIVSEEIDRTPSAVASHWYTVTSKDPRNLCFFAASPVHVSCNRKNGAGVSSTNTIWNRLVRIIRNLF